MLNAGIRRRTPPYAFADFHSTPPTDRGRRRMTSRNQPVSHATGRFPERPIAAERAAAWQKLLHDEVAHRALDEPGRLLSAYFRERERSSLGQIVSTANKLAAACETVFVVGPRAAIKSVEMLIAATTHPFHNWLGPGGRAGRARLIALEACGDNDLLQGALDLVRRACDGPTLHDRWALAVVDGDVATTDAEKRLVAATAAPLAAALQAAATNDDDLRTRLYVLSRGAADELLPRGLAHTSLPLLEPALFFNGPALFGATLVGDDTVTLLKGATWFWEAARRRLAAESPIVQLAEFLAQPEVRIAAWHHSVEPLARRFAATARRRRDDSRMRVVAPFHAAESLDEDDAEHAPTLHLWAESVRRDRLAIAPPEERAAAAAAQPGSAEIQLTRPSDVALGELCQWFTAVQILESLTIRSDR